ncbi:MAG: RNA polymerase subunit sigma-70 [Deltaproteobacteria bacterium]|nr:RNA polymerase subunit sigma-70 [Deltaproteobacteria bacterium]
MDTIDLNDPRLLERLRRRDERAFALLFRHSRDRIYNTVLRMVGCPAEAQDVTQEVYLKAYRALAGFRGDASVMSWLYRIAVNQVRSRIKHQARRRRLYHDPLDEERQGADRPTSAGLERPDRLLEGARLERFLVRALHAMEPDFREVVVLRDIEGLSYAEVQEATGLEMGTVKSRLYRGRKWLAERLAERERGELHPKLSPRSADGPKARPLVLAAFLSAEVGT